MRRQDWAFFVVLGAGVVAVIALLTGHVGSAVLWTGLALAAAWAARHWSRLYPAPMPHALRWFLELPHPFQSPRDLRRVLAPVPGERILEIGPGIGYHALPLAGWLAPEGSLDVLDVQQPMLNDLMRRAAARGIHNVIPTRGSAEHLPFPDASFDAAYLMTVLGEIPDQDAALRELRRVLKPHGRLVVGEFFLDPDFLSPGQLRALVGPIGFTFDRQAGPSFAYMARFAAR